MALTERKKKERSGRKRFHVTVVVAAAATATAAAAAAAVVVVVVTVVAVFRRIGRRKRSITAQMNVKWMLMALSLFLSLHLIWSHDWLPWRRLPVIQNHGRHQTANQPPQTHLIALIKTISMENIQSNNQSINPSTHEPPLSLSPESLGPQNPLAPGNPPDGSIVIALNKPIITSQPNQI